MPILTPPSYTGLQRHAFKLMTMTQVFPGMLRAGGQTYAVPAALWTGEFTLPLKTPAEAGPWRAFLVDLQGPAGRFYMGDPDSMTPQGSAGGAPLVAGAGQTGSSLAIDGCTPSVTGWLKRGDYFAFDTPGGGRELKMITGADVDTDAGGLATLIFKPPIRVSPADNTTIIVQNPTCIMQLVDDEQASWTGNQNRAQSFGFKAVEAVKLS